MKTEIEQAIEKIELRLNSFDAMGVNRTVPLFVSHLKTILEAAKRTAEVEKQIERLSTQLHDEQLAHRVTSERYQSSLDQLQSQAEDVKKIVGALTKLVAFCDSDKCNIDGHYLDCSVRIKAEALSTPTAQKYLNLNK